MFKVLRYEFQTPQMQKHMNTGQLSARYSDSWVTWLRLLYLNLNNGQGFRWLSQTTKTTKSSSENQNIYPPDAI